MADDAKIDRRHRWERRYQSVLLSIATAAILWVMQATIESRTDLAAIKPRIETIEASQAGAYSAASARRDFAELARRIDAGDRKDVEHDQRLDQIEHRVDAIEGTTRRTHR